MAYSSAPWIRYRFCTRLREEEDYSPSKPLTNPEYWISGYGDDYGVLIAFLPSSENLHDYWEDAFRVTTEEYEAIEYSERFPKSNLRIARVKRVK